MPILGYWKDLQGRTLDWPVAWPHPKRLVGRWDPLERERVLAYLRGADVRINWRGLSYCRFEHCDADAFEMGFRDYTDGIWVWPEGLAHYVEKHDVGVTPL